MAKKRGVMVELPDDVEEEDDVDPDAEGDLAVIDLVRETELEFYLYRVPTNPDGTPRKMRHLPMVEHWVGSFDLDKIAEKHGGGEFKVIAKKSDGTIHSARRFALEGPPSYRGAGVAAASTATPAVGDIEDQMLASLTKQYRIATLTAALDRLQRPPATPPPTATPGPDPLAMLERAVNLLRGSAPATDPTKILDFSLGMVDRVQRHTRSSDGGGAGWVDLAREVMSDTVPRVLEFIAGRPAPPRPVATAVQTSAPAAPVLNGGAPAPPPPPPAGGGPLEQLQTLIQVVRAAYDKQTEPEALADALEEFLAEPHLAFLREKGEDQVLALLDRFSSDFRETTGAAPEINAEALKRRDYVRAVLVALRTPPAAEEAPPSS